MADYAVGDLQGCLDPLLELLDQVCFDPEVDCLYSVGDVVNRGPRSLDTLRFCKSLGNSFRMVLGNHDLHLLAVAHGIKSPNRKDTQEEILQADDRDELLHWLQQQPLIRRVNEYTMVHAGIPHIWSIDQAFSLASEVEESLRSSNASTFFKAMYGNLPATWSNQLTGPTRLRVITNYLTRMRFCTADGSLDLTTKSNPQLAPGGYAPWYSYPSDNKRKIIFGHWAALEGKPCGDSLYPLDTGCVWGGPLRIMNIQTGELWHSQTT